MLCLRTRMGHLIFQDILIIFLVSIPAVLIVHQLRLPAMIGFLATGAIIGPFGIGLIHEEAQINILAEIGITLLLFTVGLEFSFRSFQTFRIQSLLSGLLQIGVTIGLGMAVAIGLGWSPYSSFYMCCVIALSSTALVFSSMQHNRSIDSIAGTIATAILIIQDIALVPMMALLPLFRQARVIDVEWLPRIAHVGRSLLIIAAVVIVGRFLAKQIFRQILVSKTRDLFVVAVIVIALGMAWLTQQFGFTFALGAFLGGLMIGGTAYKYQALSEVAPIRYAFNSLFFVSIGMLLDFEFIANNFLLILALVLALPVFKAVVTTGVTAAVGIPIRIAIVVGISLGQIGEFSFLLAYTAQKMGVLTPYVFQLIVAVAVVAMTLTPIMVQYAPRIADMLCRLPPLRRLMQTEQEKRLEHTSDDMQGHVIICGFGPLGKTLGSILKKHAIPYIVLELNPKTVELIQRLKEPVFFGDGASEEILYRCGIDHARILAITVPDYLNSAAIIGQARAMNPHIEIITRAKYRDQVEKLYSLGADVVVSEELEGGIEMGRYALREVGIGHKEIDAFIAKIREFGSADFF